MLDPRDEFLVNVTFSDVYIKEYPKIAFLCGGVPTPLDDVADRKRYFPSVRSYIAAKLEIEYSSLVFVNAEDVKDWSSYNIYSDLIEFERDVAYVCKLIVLFVESPGSIAELGSFAIIQEIANKLIVFVHQDFSSEDSYISLGPLKKLANTYSNIHYIKWATEKKHVNKVEEIVLTDGSMSEWDNYVCESISDAIEIKTNISKNSDEYSRTKEILFIHELIMLFQALSEEEISNYLKITRSQITKEKLKQGLFCLLKLNLIKSFKSGAKVFYIPFDSRAKRYMTLPATGDTARLAMNLAEYYKHHTQFIRREAIKEIGN